MKAALILCFAISTYAALPPLAQSVRELQAILADPHVQEELGSAEAIEEIVRTDNGYELKTQSRRLPVDVQYKPAKRPGPVPFELQFYPAINRHLA